MFLSLKPPLTPIPSNVWVLGSVQCLGTEEPLPRAQVWFEGATRHLPENHQLSGGRRSCRSPGSEHSLPEPQGHLLWALFKGLGGPHTQLLPLARCQDWWFATRNAFLWFLFPMSVPSFKSKCSWGRLHWTLIVTTLYLCYVHLGANYRCHTVQWYLN